MAKVSVTFKTEEDIKEQFDKTCEELGITMTAALNLFMKQVIIQERIPFEPTKRKFVKTDIRYNDEEQSFMIESDTFDGNMEAMAMYLERILEKRKEK